MFCQTIVNMTSSKMSKKLLTFNEFFYTYCKSVPGLAVQVGAASHVVISSETFDSAGSKSAVERFFQSACVVRKLENIDRSIS